MQLTNRTAPEGSNYHLIAAKVGFRDKKRDNGGLVFHETPQMFLLTKLVAKEDVQLANAC